MMKKSLLVLAVSVALTAAAFAAPEKSAKAPSVGEFAVKVNAALGKVAADQKAAAESLRTLGVDLGKDLNAALTEERAASILRDLGVKVAPGRADSELSAAKADQLITGVSLSASSAASTVPASDLPPDCLNEQNRGQCVDCCKVHFGCPLEGEPKLEECAGVGTRCAKFCKAILPPGKSPSEPQ
ncbi:MAG: hypothetical protein HY510_08330 [Acidobacteria bacterium]|nr:hypothetical protein [Acidobacteriota bacterium]